MEKFTSGSSMIKEDYLRKIGEISSQLPRCHAPHSDLEPVHERLPMGFVFAKQGSLTFQASCDE